MKKGNNTAKSPGNWTSAERLDAILTTHSMDEQALNSYCRLKGIFNHHLKQWREDYESDTTPSSSSHLAEPRDLKSSHKNLQSELNRKEKALAEAASLLVLQKSSRRSGRTRKDDSIKLGRSKIKNEGFEPLKYANYQRSVSTLTSQS